MLPAAFQPPDTYQPLHLGVTATLLVGYPVFGALLCGILGAALGKVNQHNPAIAAALGPFTVLAAVTAQLSTRLGYTRLVYMGVAAGAICLTALAVNVWSGKWKIGTRRAINAWTAAFLPLGVVCAPVEILSTEPSPVQRVAVAVIYTAFVLLLAHFGSSLPPVSTRQGRILTMTALTFGVFAACAAVDSGFHFRAPEAKAFGTAASRPNVILIVLDTVRADHLSVYGYNRDTTPSLKRFAADATSYPRATSSWNWTLPSHASLFTGPYAIEHGAYCQNQRQVYRQLSGRFETVAEVLKTEGYATAAVVANITMLLPRFNLDQGFQYYAVRPPVTPLVTNRYADLVRSAIRNLAMKFVEDPANPRVYRRAEEINVEAFSILSQFRASGTHSFCS